MTAAQKRPFFSLFIVLSHECKVALEMVNDRNTDDEELRLRNLRSGGRGTKSEQQEFTHEILSGGLEPGQSRRRHPVAISSRQPGDAEPSKPWCFLAVPRLGLTSR